MSDLLGYPYTKEMKYDPESGLIKHDVDYVREDGVHIKETNVAVLQYRYDDNHWIIYRPNIMGKMAVCIKFEGKYYLLYQSPRTLDRIFTFLHTEVLKGAYGKIKKWNIRYPSKNEKVTDWLHNKSPPIYSHNDFTCMLTWYLNNLWLFDGWGLTPKNMVMTPPSPSINNTNNNDDLLEWKEQISIVNDQYQSSVNVILTECPESCDGNGDCNNNSPIAIEVTYLSKINGRDCQMFQYFNFRGSAGSSAKFYERNAHKFVEWSGSKSITKFNHVKNMLKVLTNKNNKTNLKGMLNECMMNKYAPLPTNYHSNQEIITQLYQEQEQLRQDRKNWVKNIMAVNKEYSKTISRFIKTSKNPSAISLLHNKTHQILINHRSIDSSISSYIQSFTGFIQNFSGKRNYRIRKLPQRYVYTNTKEQLADLYTDRQEINEIQYLRNWMNGINKVNSEYFSKFKYVDDKIFKIQMLVYSYNQNSLNDRSLNKNLVNEIDSYTNIRNFMTGKVNGKLVTNYVYSCTKEQLYKLCHNPYNIITTYNINF